MASMWNDLKVQLKEAESKGDREKGIALCREMLPLTSAGNLRPFYRVRVKLASFLIADSEEPIPQENIEEALGLFKELEGVIRKDNDAKKWAETQYFLGWLYSMYDHGDGQYNLDISILHLERALEFYTQKDFPIDWAMTKVLIGEVYSRTYSGDVISRCRKALENLNEAIKVFTPSDFPEDFQEAQKSIQTLQLRIDER